MLQDTLHTFQIDPFRREITTLANLRIIPNIRAMPNVLTPTNLADFRGWQSFLRQEIRKARAREKRLKSLPAIQTVYGTTLTAAYSCYQQLSEAHLMSQLDAFLGRKRGPKVDGAKLIFRLIEGAEVSLPASTRTEWALLVDLVFRCKVPPDRMLGFLYEVGTYADQLSFARSKRIPEAANRYR